MDKWTVFIIACGTLSVAGHEDFNHMKVPEDANLTFPELGRKYGFNVIEHDVYTEDGYILRLFNLQSSSRKPVFLMHGIIDSADTFILRGADSLAVTLARRGYDVWAGNARGCKYSRRHVALDPDRDQQFWDYTFHEIGYYDLPAMIDYTLAATGRRRLSAIGHSQGTTNFYVMGATRPEYNDKIDIMIFCLEELFLNGGFDPKELEPEFAPVLFGHYPDSTSRKNTLHTAQQGLTTEMSQYDYGPEGNLERYGSKKPPVYDLNKVTMKIALLVGRNDKVATVRDAKMLSKKLANVVLFHVLRRKEANHLDFVWGRHMYKYLFPIVFNTLREFSK